MTDGAANTNGADGRDPVTGQFRRGHKFAKGNPSMRHLASAQRAIREAFRPTDLVDVLESLRIRALAGDVAAARAFLGRVMGSERAEETPINVEMPPLGTARECAAAVTKILDDLTNGRIDRAAARLLLDGVDQARRAVETADLERRLAQLEQRGPDGQAEQILNDLDEIRRRSGEVTP